MVHQRGARKMVSPYDYLQDSVGPCISWPNTVSALSHGNTIQRTHIKNYKNKHAVETAIRLFARCRGAGYLRQFLPLASQSAYFIIVYTVANYILLISHFWGNLRFLRSQLFTYSTNILVRLLTVI